MAANGPDTPTAEQREQVNPLAQALHEAPDALHQLAHESAQRLLTPDSPAFDDIVNIDQGIAMASVIQQILNGTKIPGVTLEELQEQEQLVEKEITLPSDLHPEVRAYVAYMARVLALLNEGKQLLDPNHEEGKALQKYDEEHADPEGKRPTLAAQLKEFLLSQAQEAAKPGQTVETIDDAIRVGREQIFAKTENLLEWDKAIKKEEKRRATPVAPDVQNHIHEAVSGLTAFGETAVKLLPEDQDAQKDLKIQPGSVAALRAIEEVFALFPEGKYPITQGEVEYGAQFLGQKLQALEEIDVHPDVHTYSMHMLFSIAILREAQQLTDENNPEYKALIANGVSSETLKGLEHTVISAAQSIDPEVTTLDAAVDVVLKDLLADPKHLKSWNEALRNQEIAAIIDDMSAPFEAEVDMMLRYQSLGIFTAHPLRKAWGVNWRTVGRATKELRKDVQIGDSFSAESSRGTVSTFVRQLLEITKAPFSDILEVRKQLEQLDITLPVSQYHKAVMKIVSHLYNRATIDLKDQKDSAIKQADLDRQFNTLALSETSAKRLDALETFLLQRDTRRRRS